jgi:hypothetical protein
VAGNLPVTLRSVRSSPVLQEPVSGPGGGLIWGTPPGAQPALYTVNGKTVRPLGEGSDKALARLNALDCSCWLIEEMKEGRGAIQIEFNADLPGASSRPSAPSDSFSLGG